jgi:cephalosporin hydroxylase
MRGAQGADRLLRGFYESNGDWRPTAKAFAVSLDPPEAGATYLRLDCGILAESISAYGQVNLTATVNGVEVGRETYTRGGQVLFERSVPANALKRGPAEVAFEVDKTYRDPGSGRDVGVYAVSVSLIEYERTAEYRERQLPALSQAYERLRQRRNLPVSAEREQDMMKLFHNTTVWEYQWFHDVQILKNPLDLWSLQDIIWELRPDFIIETGTFNGGSALYSASVLNGMGLDNSRVLTVDINDFTYTASAHPLWKKYVDFYLGSSTDPGIVASISARVKGRKVLVSLDSDHSMHHVLKELWRYSPLVSRGSYIVVEDTNLDGVPVFPNEFPGPFAAVVKFLADGGDRDFEQDLRREQSGTTFYPGGWLRRK